MATTTNLNSLVINYLTQAQYDAAAAGGTLNENQLYLTPSETLATVATSGSYNDLSDKPSIPVNTDEKVKQKGISSSFNAEKNILLSNNLDTALDSSDTTNTTYKATWLTYRSGGGNGPYLYIKNPSSPTSIFTRLSPYVMQWGDNGYIITLSHSTPTQNNSLTLPNKSGTIALTSDVSKTQLIRWTEV